MNEEIELKIRNRILLNFYYKIVSKLLSQKVVLLASQMTIKVKKLQKLTFLFNILEFIIILQDLRYDRQQRSVVYFKIVEFIIKWQQITTERF